MSHRKIDRREALVRIGASAVAPLVAGFHPSVPVQPGGFAPRFLDGAELEAVTALSERIIPETETPGARGALVHQYIDFVLSRAEGDVRERFRAGLGGLDASCRAAWGRSVAELDSARQDELLARFLSRPSTENPALVAFVEDFKRLTVEGYYRSEPGMRQELGFDGNTFVTEFDGCTHDEHRSWKPGV
jgi:hypothetical protein